jgi:carboxymethylenebutenolidase
MMLPHLDNRPARGFNPQKEAMSRINCLVYGFYGGNDARINATIPETKELMAGAGKTYEPIIYDGAGHGFMRAGEGAGASEANRKGRAAAWERWKSILEKL